MDVPEQRKKTARLDAVLDVWRAAGEQHWLVVCGSSMQPLIEDGDQVLVDHGTSFVRRGDLVVLKRGTQLIVHRAIACAPRLVTKGDNLLQMDAAGAVEDLVGRVLAVQTSGRRTRIDGLAWRLLGWFIASGALAQDRLAGWARPWKRRLVGSRPGGLFGRLRGALHAGQKILLRAAQVVLRGPQR